MKRGNIRKHKWIRQKEDKRIIDIFAHSSGYHNGPECSVCGKSFCHHCNPECYKEECLGRIGL